MHYRASEACTDASTALESCLHASKHTRTYTNEILHYRALEACTDASTFHKRCIHSCTCIRTYTNAHDRASEACTDASTYLKRCIHACTYTYTNDMHITGPWRLAQMRQHHSKDLYMHLHTCALTQMKFSLQGL